MTLSKKGSRKIIVEDEPYRWTISAKGKGLLALIVEHGMEKGQKIEVHIQSDINDFWVEFPHVDGLNLKVVTPKEVAGIISEAVKEGWTPKQKGAPLVLEWASNQLTRK